ncbi:MAG TPA: GH92 family glycosyl hydrolase, partial [Bacteroidia bacterium]|nr:GH92 family glycosyl hydrolase [Bacteroidia bacterium]
YHTAIHPSLYTDVNGQYRGRDMKTHTAQGYSVYSVFSIWDTYRAIHPLYTIIDSSIDRQFIQTFLRQYEQGGALPVWELSANETNCMIGYHSVSVIADAYLKGITGFDANEALKAMKHSTESEERGLPALREYGYIPANKGSESVSQTLELGYDDWCIAQMAKALSNMDDYAAYIKLAQAYKNEYNPNNGFMQGRMNGAFVKPFNPRAVTFDYTEANAWQYSFYAPQDMSGLIALHGGKEKLAQMLDTLFTTNSIMTGREQPDITGMIGQYAQGNEPSHHIAYLYNYVGQPWNTAKYVRQLEKFYTSQPDGICGNDDCGELSAWYVMSAIGMYQVCPGDGQFELTSPLFDTIKIHLESGKTFSIISQKSKPNSICIKSATLNGKDYKQSYLRYTDLMNGGNLHYNLDDMLFLDTYYDSTIILSNWGVRNNVPIDSIPASKYIVPQPYFEYTNAIFTDSLKVTLKGFSPKDSVCIVRQIVDSTGSSSIRAELYTKPFYIHESGNYGYYMPHQKRANTTGHEQWEWEYLSVTTQFTKIPKGRKIKIVSKPNSQYTAGGPQALIDYQHGGTDFRLGQWQGYQSQDFEAVVDLGKEETISEVNAEFLQDTRSWILMPKYVDFSVSDDSIHFTPVAHVENTLPDTTFDPTIESLGKKITPQKTRYVKVFVKNYGKLPAWHPGFGDDAFIFIDEIEIK